MNIKVYKLTTGEEVLAEVVSETEDLVKLKNPVLVVMQRTQTGETALGFMPFMAYVADKTVVVKTDKIILDSEVDEQLVNQYNSIFGSGIVVPPKTLITG